jgi:hypothetical protein
VSISPQVQLGVAAASPVAADLGDEAVELEIGVVVWASHRG